jgi:1,2-dihydroxy-3-keto-5-methylthiopentene dioxygenase
MTVLQVMADDDRDQVRLRTSDIEVIATTLSAHGVRIERWQTRPLAEDSGENHVLKVYADEVRRVSEEGRYSLVDVVRLHPDAADAEWDTKAKAAREKFLDEHTHDEDEIRFFVDGRGCFYLHLGDEVHAVVCEAGDLMWIPPGTKHWFDMGHAPDFCAIRFFQEENGWVAGFTGATISARMPSLDELLGNVS